MQKRKKMIPIVDLENFNLIIMKNKIYLKHLMHGNITLSNFQRSI